MSLFQDHVKTDLHKTFLNCDFFGEKRNLIYGGEHYDDVPVVIAANDGTTRTERMADHSEGIYQRNMTLHCAVADIGGALPEVGSRLEIMDTDDEGFYRRYYISAAYQDMGMCRLILDAYDE